MIYWVIGVPVAWILWYYRLYNAAKKDAAFTYAWFFLAYLVHIFWCIWSAVCAPLPTSDRMSRWLRCLACCLVSVRSEVAFMAHFAVGSRRPV